MYECPLRHPSHIINLFFVHSWTEAPFSLKPPDHGKTDRNPKGLWKIFYAKFLPILPHGGFRIMWEFQVEQKIFQIGKVKVGGIPGERPTVLAGSIFYHGDKIVQDEMAGEFDKKAAEDLIKLQEEFSDRTGNPCMIDLVGASPEAMIKELEFVASLTDTPILVDSPAMNVRVRGLRYAEETGLINRIVYNSIMPETKSAELKEIRESKLESAILLAYNPTDFTSEGRKRTIKSLLLTAKEVGIKKPLLDTCVIDVPTLGMACKTLFKVKDETGYPVGAGTHNAIGTWRGLKNKMGKQAVIPCSVSAAIMAIVTGADFVLYGPIKDAQYFFPAAAMVDAAYGQLIMEKGKRLSTSHPLFKIA